MKITINLSKWNLGTILVTSIGIVLSVYIQKDKINVTDPDIKEVKYSANVQQQSFVRQNSYPIPDLLEIDISNYNNDPLGLLTDGIRPIGWSKSGKFAYVIEPADEACACYFFEIYIQDLITDKILWKWQYNSGSNLSENNADDINKVWKKMNSMFTQQLNNHEIMPISNVKLQKTPIAQGNYNYDFPIVNKELPNPMLDGTPIASTSIYMNRNNKRVIRIYNQTENDSYSFINNKIMGYIQSPYENRIAILYSALMRGYEGPPNVVKLSIIGCNLDYKKY